MKFRILISLVTLFFLTNVLGQVQDRPFPYFLSLTGDEKPDGIEEDIRNGPKEEDRYTKHGLFLTRGGQESSFTGFYLSEIEFPSNYGLEIKFKYAMANGSTYNGSYGDGLTMFLFDAEEEFSLGGPGGSLGYAYRNTQSGYGPGYPGLNGAYLGIGLDAYGEFKMRMNSATEMREGIYGLSYTNFQDHVTIRGGQYLNDRYKGYPVLFTTQVTYGDSSFPTIAEAILDPNTGDYRTQHGQMPILINGLRTNYRDYNDTYEYNQVEVDLKPISMGMELNIRLGNDREGIRSVISYLDYLSEYKTRDQNGNLYNFEIETPKFFRIGFAASTGSATQDNIVKDIEINLPYAPYTEDSNSFICMNNGRNSISKREIDVFEKASFGRGKIGNSTWGNDARHIDFASFRFENQYGFKIGDKEYKEPYAGTWKFDIDTHMVTFYPEDDIEEGEYSVYFSAHSVDDGSGGPFADHAFRCRPTKVTVEVKKCKAMVNPNMPIRVKMKSD